MQITRLNFKQIHCMPTYRISNNFNRKTILIQNTIIIKKIIIKRKKKQTINNLKSIMNKTIKKILIKKFKHKKKSSPKNFIIKKKTQIDRKKIQ